MSESFICPICGYPALSRQPRSDAGGGSYEICPSCGFQFGVSDEDLGYTDEEWRAMWVDDNYRWRGVPPQSPPSSWDGDSQLASFLGAEDSEGH